MFTRYEKRTPSRKNLLSLQKAFYVEKKMEKGLGQSKIL